MTTKTLFIDLRTRGGQRTKTELVGVGQSGQRALQRIAGAAQPASAGLLAVSRASAATRGAIRSLSGQVGGLIAAYAGFSGLRRSVQLFADFDEGLIAVAKTTDLSQDEVRKFGRSITDLSKRIPVAAKELLDIGATAGQLGVSGSRDLLRFTDTVAKLGRASNLAGEEAATSLARMLNVTGENIGEVGRLASVIVRLGNNMAVTEREIARMATEVSLATTNFRVGTTAASAIGAAMASVGIRAELGGSAVGRAFRTINSAVLSGGVQLEKLSRIAGVTGNELVRVFKRDSVAAFNLFLKGLARMQTQGADVAHELKAIGLGGEEINKVLPVLANRFDLLADAQRMAADEARNTTALNREAEAAFRSFSNQMRLLQNNAEAALRVLGAELAPAIVTVKERLVELLANGSIEQAAKTVGFAFQSLASNIDLVVRAVAGLFLARKVGAAFGLITTSLMGNAGAIAGFRLIAAISPLAAARLAAVGLAAKVASASLGLLRGGLVLLGGPAGLAILAGIGLYELVRAHKEAQSAALSQKLKVSELNTVLAEATVASRNRARELYSEAIAIREANKAEIERIKTGLAAAKARIGGVNPFSALTSVGGGRIGKTAGEMVVLGKAIAQANKIIVEQNENIAALEQRLGGFADTSERAAKSSGTLSKSAEDGSRSLDGLRRAFDKLERSLDPSIDNGEKLTKGLELLSRAHRQLGIDLPRTLGLMSLLRRKYAQTTDAVAMHIDELRQEVRLLGFSKAAGEKEVAVLKARNIATKQGTILSAKQEREIRALIGRKQKLKTAEKALQKQDEARKRVLGELRNLEDRHAKATLSEVDLVARRRDRELSDWRRRLDAQKITSREYTRAAEIIQADHQRKLTEIAQTAQLERERLQFGDGAIAAARNYFDSLKEHGRLAGDFLTNSVFRPLEQTLAGFYATGKANFGDFKDAVVKGLADLAAKATVSFAGSAASGAVQTIGSKIGGGVVDKVIDFFKFADGGLVTGPGHDRSDNVPALLSPGEFVLSAKAVRRLGLPAIAAANDGTLSPSIGPDGIPHYGFGGFVKKITGAFKSVVKGAANAIKSLATPQGLLTLAASLALPGLGSALAGAFLPAAGAAQAAALGFGSSVIPGISAVSSSLISRLAGGVASSFASGIFGRNLSTSAVLQLAGEAVAKRGILGAIGIGGGGEGLLGSQIQDVLPGVASSRTFDLGAVVGPAFGNLLDGITTAYGDAKHTAAGVRESVSNLPGFSYGGLVRGPDTVPALLSPGEFVMRRNAVTAFGQPALEAMNRGRIPVQVSVSNDNRDVVSAIEHGSQIADLRGERLERELIATRAELADVKRDLRRVLAGQAAAGVRAA
jgi:TP901 family phage tail tape measure protein